MGVFWGEIERGEEGRDLVVEMVFEVGSLFGAEGFLVVVGQASFGELREEFFLEEFTLIFTEAAEAFVDCAEKLGDGVAGGRGVIWGSGVQGVKSTKANLEKFIEIGFGDGEEF